MRQLVNIHRVVSPICQVSCTHVTLTWCMLFFTEVWIDAFWSKSLLINKDTMVVKYSPASWSNIIELQDPATFQENVKYVRTSTKISPEFGLSCMMTMMILVVVV